MISLFNDLQLKLKGDLLFDSLTRTLYATDASVYREMPLAVVHPKDAEDVKTIVKFANENKVGLIPRAGGTSLAGQCVGNGIVIDVSKYMNQILEINAQEKWVRVQPGVVPDHLNVFLKEYGLFFGPNTSTSNRCNIGGMVGNNSSGTTSIVYGSTRDHVLEIKAVLSDGSQVVFNALEDQMFLDKQNGDNLEAEIYRHIYKLLDDEDHKEHINNHFPKPEVTRRNTGYALDALVKMQPFTNSNEAFNFCKLLCGSEGTLAFTAEVKLNLVDLQKPYDVVVAAHFKSINESMKATVVAMEHQPTACELMDKTILDCTKGQIEHEANRFFVEGDPAAILLVEFREGTVEEAELKAKSLISQFKQNNLGYGFPLISGAKTEGVWQLRKAGLGLLANIPGDKKAVACIEDTAVAVEDLPEYIDEFSTMMSTFDQKAVYYAHAGAGELHLRPILDLKKSKDIQDFKNISEASAKLVKKYKGSLSGEHGDGRVRAEFIPLVLGEENYQFLKSIKGAWDPNNIFNPGKIVNPKPMESNLRYEPDVPTSEIETIFNFDETGGILRTVEKCNGSGDCRKLNFAGGTMCPSYRVTLDEKDTTRGRANVLREFLTQNTKENPFDHPEIKTAMDLCISCKGCKSECPSNIDMATLKAEFQYQYNRTHKPSLRTKLIANNAKHNTLAIKFRGVHNFLVKQDWFKRLVGLHKKRTLPLLSKETLRTWLRDYKQPKNSKNLFLFIDEYTNYYDTEIGKKTVLLLNKLGYNVKIVDHPESGRAYISKGFLDEAKKLAKQNVSLFKDRISQKEPLVGIEPSAILSFRDEYPNLVNRSLQSDAIAMSRNVFLIDEFLDSEVMKGNVTRDQFKAFDEAILLHGHCHQKALSSQSHTVKLLELITNKVEVIPSGCCGMAGSFGYEKEHYDLSMRIGSQVLFPEVKKSDKNAIIVAPGTSCRHQIKDGTDREAFHPVEILYNALKH